MEKIRVGDLRRFLENRGWSPEIFAKEVKLSHMTIRRWLSKEDSKVLPAKYFVILAPHLGLASASTAFTESLAPTDVASHFSATSISGMVDDLEKTGHGCLNTETVTNDIKTKLKRERFDKIFVEYCRTLMRVITSSESSKKSKAIAIGALVYFLNPIDLIPDHIPVIGYLDDLAVLSLAVNTLSKEVNKLKLPQSENEGRIS